ncbi:hypothetical protein [Hyphomonas oceanitis]|uniref:Amino acid permease-associated protein n=1 Tax=Hyphomonas oceanitis SCH89 TaxID=1280953 RepID=A0A059G896_9PROT|nr:hypothetical protein [Hyphomonas oceanitis]KDA02919.1 amino acid permease-associated protein [Hyphomonas oceanitis SCH89]
MGASYEKNSLTLPGAVAMGTGVMIGAGIFAFEHFHLSKSGDEDDTAGSQTKDTSA